MFSEGNLDLNTPVRPTAEQTFRPSTDALNAFRFTILDKTDLLAIMQSKMVADAKSSLEPFGFGPGNNTGRGHLYSEKIRKNDESDRTTD